MELLFIGLKLDIEMALTKKQFTDDFMDRIYLNGSKEDERYTLTLSQAEHSASELYDLIKGSFVPEKKEKERLLDKKIELANLIREKFTAIRFKETSHGNIWDADFSIGAALINICFKYYSGKKYVYGVDILRVGKDRTYTPISQREIKMLTDGIKSGVLKSE